MADPKGRTQDQVAYQNKRFESQQGPMVDAMAYNYGRGSEANYGDYTDIMNQYRGIASGAGGSSGSSGGGGGYAPSLISYNDPFKSYGGYEEFSKTGGYDRNDIANMRSRGVSPIRASYANAEREMGRQRSLQGGYSPNAFAVQGRMAREQGQLGADAMQNVEAGLAEARNKGRLSGLSGMSDIEKQRLAADLEVGKFNANAQMQAAAASSAAASRADEQRRLDQFRALQGMTSLYGTTPGMTNVFGSQLLNAVNMGANQGADMLNAGYRSETLPGAFEQTTNRIRDIGDMAGRAWNPMQDYLEQRNRRQPQVNYDYGDQNYGQPSNYDIQF
jgi:hypothetical protein